MNGTCGESESTLIMGFLEGTVKMLLENGIDCARIEYASLQRTK